MKNLLEKRQGLFKQRDNSGLIMFAVLVLAIIGLVMLLKLADPQTLLTLRHMYCTANEANALECTAKGWW